jgi:hypothetical protein
MRSVAGASMRRRLAEGSAVHKPRRRPWAAGRQPLGPARISDNAVDVNLLELRDGCDRLREAQSGRRAGRLQSPCIYAALSFMQGCADYSGLSCVVFAVVCLPVGCRSIRAADKRCSFKGRLLGCVDVSSRSRAFRMAPEGLLTPV